LTAAIEAFGRQSKKEREMLSPKEESTYKETFKDKLQRFLVSLLPQMVARWLWRRDIPLGSWTPHILGRSMGGSITWKRIK
jgi:hypothetical protein